MIEKEVSIGARRERRFYVTTLFLFLATLFIVLILGIFINNSVKSRRLYEELYFPETNTYICPSPSSSYNPRIITNTTNQSRHLVSSTQDLRHSMSDQELLSQALEVSHQIDEFSHNISKNKPKVAFLFLTRGKLPLAPFWEIFFKGNEGFFSIYLHTSPDFIYEPSKSSVFYKRRVPSKEVQWGKPSMIDAERRLLANALLDISNERFILLSETCIPLFNFPTIYNYLINSKKSYLSCFDDPRSTGRGRYNKRMAPTITLADWRKGSQWFEVHRKLATAMIADESYYPIFRNHCMPPCYMDEHYFPTLVTKIDPQLTSNRPITWTDWSAGGPHPRRFVNKDVSEGLLNYIRYGSNCTYNGAVTSLCFLFARKFHPSTLQPLLELAPTVL
ncbi:transferase [Lithospermum erythrorhizon]|uniref:Transferase n=1 Tax=Lithospermum erythrorhizon TaxID=34254 RepID=A0AAV3NJY1_LITER